MQLFLRLNYLEDFGDFTDFEGSIFCFVLIFLADLMTFDEGGEDFLIFFLEFCELVELVLSTLFDRDCCFLLLRVFDFWIIFIGDRCFDLTAEDDFLD